MNMLKQLLQMYAGFMTYGTTGAIGHMVGPPGSGKSTVAQELAMLLGVDLHVISVARLNPLESEGVQMPVGENDDMILQMLPAAMWTRMKDGDIVLFDEFLRGFPEVYNALLDVFTSRKVGSMALPKVFMIAASNSVSTYDEALEDRLLHMPVADPRHNKREKNRLIDLFISELGLFPDVAHSLEMDAMMQRLVLPTFNVMDTIGKNKARNVDDSTMQGKSIRNLIAQVQLRQVQNVELKTVIEENNRLAMIKGKPQYVVLLNTKTPADYVAKAELWLGNAGLTGVQARNYQMNMQMIEFTNAEKEKV